MELTKRQWIIIQHALLALENEMAWDENPTGLYETIGWDEADGPPPTHDEIERVAHFVGNLPHGD